MTSLLRHKASWTPRIICARTSVAKPFPIVDRPGLVFPFVFGGEVAFPVASQSSGASSGARRELPLHRRRPLL